MSDKINVLLITGIVTDEHDPKVNPMLKFLLESTGRFKVKITEEFTGCTSKTLEKYDLVLINYDGKENTSVPFVGRGAETEAALYDFVRQGGGAILYHSSIINPGEHAYPDEFVRLVGMDLNFAKGMR